MTATPLSNPREDRTVVLAVRLTLDGGADGATINLSLAVGAAPPDGATPVLMRLHTDELVGQNGDAPALWEAAPRLAPVDTACTPLRLSAREAEVLRLLTAGHTNPEIAATLVLSTGTVARHTANIYTKLGARGRAEAVAFAVRHGLAG